MLIGSTVTEVPPGLAATATPAATAGTQSTGARVIGARAATGLSATPTPSSTAGSSSGTGGSITVAPNAPYGIPCVY